MFSFLGMMDHMQRNRRRGNVENGIGNKKMFDDVHDIENNNINGRKYDNNNDSKSGNDIDSCQPRRVASEWIIFFQGKEIERLRIDNGSLQIENTVQRERIDHLEKNIHRRIFIANRILQVDFDRLDRNRNLLVWCFMIQISAIVFATLWWYLDSTLTTMN